MADQFDVVYGETPGNPESLEFMRRADAEDRADVLDAYNTAKTWGDFRRSAPSDMYEQALVMALSVIARRGSSAFPT